VLYKDGPRKDLDLVFYRIRQQKEISFTKLWAVLRPLGIIMTRDFGFVAKATWQGRSIDFLFPEHEGGEEYI
jgi:hypothetical protein